MENIYYNAHSISIRKSFLEEILKTEVIIIELTKVECVYTFLDGEDYGLCFACHCSPNYLQAHLAPHPKKCLYCGHYLKMRNKILIKARSGSLKSLLKSKCSKFGDDMPLFDTFIEAIVKPKGTGY